MTPATGVIQPASRMLAFSKPYLLLLGIAAFFSILFSSGRYARALLLKPLLDDVLVPASRGNTEVFDLSTFFTVSASGPTPLQWIALASVGIVFLMPITSFVKSYLLQYALGAIAMDIKKTIATKLLRRQEFERCRLPKTYSSVVHVSIATKSANQATNRCRGA